MHWDKPESSPVNPLIAKYGLQSVRAWGIKNRKGYDIGLMSDLDLEKMCFRGEYLGWDFELLRPEEKKAGVAFPKPSKPLKIFDYGIKGPVGHFVNIVDIVWEGTYDWTANVKGEIVLNHWAVRCAYDFFNRGVDSPDEAYYQIAAGAGSSGKTGTFAIIALTMLYSFPQDLMCKVGTTTMRAGDSRVWGDIVKWHKRGFYHKNGFDGGEFRILQGNERRLLFYPKNGDTGKVEKATNRGIELVPFKRGADGEGAVGDLIGLKAPLKILIVDEATDVDDSVYSPTLHSNWLLTEGGKARIVFLGNPQWSARSFVEFYAPKGGWNAPDYWKGSTGWATEKGGWVTHLYGLDTPNREWRKAIDKKRKKTEAPAPFSYLISLTDIEDAEKRAQGRNTVGFSRMTEGWLCDEAMNDTVLTPRAVLAHGCTGKVEWTGEGYHPLMGCDPAFGGDDFAYCIGNIGYGYTKDRQRKVFLEIDKIDTIPFQFTDHRTAEGQQVASLVAMASSYGIGREMLSCDFSGKSGLFVGGLEAEMKGQCHRVDFSGIASERPVSESDSRKCCDAYANRNSEIVMSVREVLPYLRGMTDNIMLDEFYQRKFEIRGRNIFRVEPKPEFKKRMKGRSPDRADSVAIMIDLAKTLGLGTDRLLLPGMMARGTESWRNRATEMRLYSGNSKPGGLISYARQTA